VAGRAQLRRDGQREHLIQQEPDARPLAHAISCCWTRHAARTVAEALAVMATSPQAEFAAARAAESAGAPMPELAGPLEENLASLARLVTARRGDQVRIEEVKSADPDSEAAADGSLLPGPHARLAGPTFEEWLAAQPDSGSAA